MSLTGTTVYLHNLRRPLVDRAEARKSVGPYQWNVGQPGPFTGRGYYAKDDQGTPSAGDSTFSLRSCEPQKRAWFSGEMTAFYPVVLRLPHGRGFLAGWTMGKGMVGSIDAGIYGDEATAWDDADMQARDAAMRESEQENEEPAEEEASEEPAIDDVLADVQSRLYALQAADNLTAAQRIEIMALHSIVGTIVYDEMAKGLMGDT